MKWYRIEKENAVKPTSGHYADWKEELAKESKYQCVYCTIHENSFGGIRNYHVEHYKPKSKFKALVDDYLNLYYACSICNCFKGNDWPNDPDDSLKIICYPDPSKIDYCILFELDENFYLNGVNVPAKYIISKLYLNRPQLVQERKYYALKKNLIEEATKLNSLVKELLSHKKNNKRKNSLLEKSFNSIQEASAVVIMGSEVRPYSQSQIQK